MNDVAASLDSSVAFAYSEEAVMFGEGRWVGVLSVPSGTPKSVAIVVVGGPQYRVGSHRQFVQLSRALALQGHATLRFDCTGMGDSPGELRNFLNINEDIGAAIGFVRERLPTVNALALWGLCDGASAALLYVHANGDAGIRGLCLLNPWVRSDASQAQTQVKHYYLQRLQQAAFWRKLLTGKVAATAVLELARAVRTIWRSKNAQGGNSQNQPNRVDLPFQSRMALAWKKYSGAILLVLSGDDFTAKEFLETVEQDALWKGCLQRADVTRRDVAQADHTFSGLATRLQLEELTVNWLDELGRRYPAGVAAAPTTRT
ncbi:MAG: hydrolase 1, exosortase A system-associated [Rhizobacter sp.]